MSLSETQLEILYDYFEAAINHSIPDAEWMEDHVSISTNAHTNTVTIEIWDMNEQDFKEFERE